MKMPVKVWKEVVKIQREFLWCGLETKRKISWVNWETVTKPKCDGGLGVRDVRRVNLSLLAKWRWKLLSQEQEMWKTVIVANCCKVWIRVYRCRESWRDTYFVFGV
jgi:hypothetical protein